MSIKITCKQAVHYISKKEEGKLSPAQRFALWRHLAICSLCRLFSQQNKTIAKAIKGAHDSGPALRPEDKEEMIKNILEKD
ncbi:MAG TPA: hypothetical protein VFZ47_01455 [Chitinophagaceae bacterium]